MTYRDPRKTAVGLAVQFDGLAAPRSTGVFEDDDGHYLVFIDTKPGKEIRLNEFYSRPAFAEAVAAFLFYRGLTQSYQTRCATKKAVRYFLPYLDNLEERYGVDVRSIGDIEQHVIDGYQDYLDGSSKYGSKLKLKFSVRRARYNIISDLCRWAAASPQYSESMLICTEN